VSPAFQAKILRVLQTGEYFPVGAEQPRWTAARVLAATHRPLERLVRAGTFREDLYFRLRVVEIRVPPLRDRRGDIRMIAERLLARLAPQMGRTGASISNDAVALLERHEWPGNVRELENAIARALVMARTGALEAGHFDLTSPHAGEDDSGVRSRDDLSLGASEREHVLHVLVVTSGNKSRAAQLLRISRQRLDRILQRHGLAASDDEDAEAQS
jgi:DNA-binding NtrC family response regulator